MVRWPARYMKKSHANVRTLEEIAKGIQKETAKGIQKETAIDTLKKTTTDTQKKTQVHRLIEIDIGTQVNRNRHRYIG